MKEKVDKEKREKKNTSNKKESGLVTKESICATFAVFCFLAFLLLCAPVIFGTFGYGIRAFLTGVFGYLAYPLLLGALYLSVMGLIGKRLIKNRKIGWMIGLTVLFLTFILHTAISYTKFDDGKYLSYCFNAGETFPKTTVAGWVGGAVCFGLVKLVSEVGALIIWSLLTILFGYITVILCKKSPKEKLAQPIEGEQAPVTVENVEIPVSQTQPTAIPVGQVPMQPVQPTQPIQQPQPAPIMQSPYVPNAMPRVTQRPGVSLVENPQVSDEVAQTQANPTQPGKAFSPFGNGQMQSAPETDSILDSYEKSRAFLFGGTPAENYKRNLLFDPTAKVNTRPQVDPSQPAQPMTSAYVPSYSDAYQNSINNETQATRPIKVVSDNTQSGGYYGNTPAYSQPTPVTPVQPIVDTTPRQTETPVTRFEEPVVPVTPVAPVVPTTPERGVDRTPVVDTDSLDRGSETDREYRRHDYMDLFSTSNPNIFGREETDRKLDREERNPFAQTEERGRDEISYRDGITLLDEEPETGTRSDSRYTDITNTRNTESSRGDSLTSARTPFIAVPETPKQEEFVAEANISEADYRQSGFDRDAATTASTPAKVVQPAEKNTPPKPRIIRPYVRVPLDDFDCRDIEPTANAMEVEETKDNILSTLEEFKVTGASIASVTFGPTVTRYNVTIPRNISPRKVVALDQSIAISLHSSGVNVYPNYEDGVVSIEVPNKTRQFVQLGCMLSGDTFVNAKPSSLMFAMGKDVANRKIYGDIAKMTHLLVAGSSGSGKSVFLGALIISLIYKYSPEELRLILIDPKKTEFVLYNDLPHLMINEIITDVNKAVQSLNWAIGEMNRRYTLFEQMSRSGTYVVNLDQYNEQLEKKDRLPKIVIIIDELADLMLAAKKEMEDRIQNLTQKARAAGIHLIVATQRPSTDVITGVIKSNLATRVAFYVATDVDSRVILDQTGAQKLLGKGDFLYTMPGLVAPVRVQSAFISPEESQKVVNFIKNNNEAYFDEEATNFINSRGGYAGDDDGNGGSSEKEIDPMYIEALRYVILSGSASISMIQRKCSAGYNRAGKIVEWMEDMGYISPFDGAKARKVLITKEQFEEKYGPLQ
ncbi:MAG: hypothetical protein IJX30_03800 [Clostridia bacterium]|nr:hypothetical protein [Clostridia bacterium]